MPMPRGPRPAVSQRIPRDRFAGVVWSALRDAETPLSGRELYVRVGAHHPTSIDRLLRKWRRAGLLAVASDNPMRLRLTDDHPTPPRQRVTGAFDRKPTVRQRIWTAMRVLKRFDVPTLCMTAETPRGTTTAVVNELLRGGYLTSLETGIARLGTWSVYRVVRRSGRLAPRVQVSRREDGSLLRILFDPNDGSRADISPTAVSLRGCIKRARRPVADPDGGEN